MRMLLRTDQAVEQLLSLAVFMHGEGGSETARGVIAHDARSIADRVKSFGLDGPTLNREIFGPLKTQLVLRYGPTTGAALHDEILRVFRR